MLTSQRRKLLKFSSLNLGICCLPYLVKITGCYHVLSLLNNLPARLPNPAPILSSEFPNQNYLDSSFIFGKLPNIICVRNKNLFWLTNKWPRNPQNSFPVIAWLLEYNCLLEKGQEFTLISLINKKQKLNSKFSF